MKKGEQTREKIIERSAGLFNCHGYVGASMSDIMRVTGLGKGGIYNHFESKEELALASFDYATNLIAQRMTEAEESCEHAADKLLAIISVTQGLSEDNPIPGGCPLLNMAVESDDGHPMLRERARRAMTRWRNRVHRITNAGIKAGQIRRTVDSDTLATIMLATLEGAVMMSKLYHDRIHMSRAVDHLTTYINESVRA